MTYLLTSDKKKLEKRIVSCSKIGLHTALHTNPFFNTHCCCDDKTTKMYNFQVCHTHRDKQLKVFYFKSLNHGVMHGYLLLHACVLCIFAHTMLRDKSITTYQITYEYGCNEKMHKSQNRQPYNITFLHFLLHTYYSWYIMFY